MAQVQICISTFHLKQWSGGGWGVDVGTIQGQKFFLQGEPNTWDLGLKMDDLPSPDPYASVHLVTCQLQDRPFPHESTCQVRPRLGRKSYISICLSGSRGVGGGRPGRLE